MKIFEWFVRTLYWLQVFAAPVVLFGLIALIVYSTTDNKIVTLIFLPIGFLGGIFLAEFIRRKYGLEKFFANLYGSAEIKDRLKQ
jgi:ABC-type phosphate transport system permease subunit